MKEVVGNVVLTALLLFVFFPWIIGVMDILSWALFGAQATNIPWGSGRGWVLFAWPVLSGIVGGWVVHIVSEYFL
jgi:hypothetical protein